MESRFSLRTLVLVLSLGMATAGLACPAHELPADSLYRAETKFTNQEGKEISLAGLRGHPVVITMVYTKCTYTCPLVVQKMKNIEKSLGSSPGLRLVLVSFDHEGETPETMRQFMKEKNLDPARWLMVTGKTSGAVREIASLLEINYKKEPSGEYSHSNVLVLLDKNGVKKSVVTGIAADHSGLVKSARQEL